MKKKLKRRRKNCVILAIKVLDIQSLITVSHGYSRHRALGEVKFEEILKQYKHVLRIFQINLFGHLFPSNLYKINEKNIHLCKHLVMHKLIQLKQSILYKILLMRFWKIKKKWQLAKTKNFLELLLVWIFPNYRGKYSFFYI